MSVVTGRFEQVVKDALPKVLSQIEACGGMRSMPQSEEDRADLRWLHLLRVALEDGSLEVVREALSPLQTPEGIEQRVQRSTADVLRLLILWCNVRTRATLEPAKGSEEIPPCRLCNVTAWVAPTWVDNPGHVSCRHGDPDCPLRAVSMTREQWIKLNGK